MKVLFVTHLYPNSGCPFSGLFVREMATALRARDVDLRVLHLHGQVVWPFRRLNRYRVERVGAEVVNPEWVLRHQVGLWPKAAAITLRARMWAPAVAAVLRREWPDFKPDIVHAHMIVPSGIVGASLSRRFGCPLVVTMHGADTRLYIRRALGRAAILRVCRKAGVVTCVGPGIIASLLEHGVDKEKLCLLYNGMDLSKLHHGPNPVAERYRGKTVVLGVGNLHHQKGFDLLITAMAELVREHPNLRCVIVGGGNDHGRLSALVDRLGVVGSVELVGAKPPRETMAYMAACDIFCLPSWSEGFGIVYLEAMAHGKPVIAVQGQGITDIVTEHKTGILVPPHDADAVAGAIRKLIDNPEASRQMGMRGEALIKEKFSWEHHISSLLEIYRECR